MLTVNSFYLLVVELWVILILLPTWCYNFQGLYNVGIIFQTRNSKLKALSTHSQIFHLMITESLKKSSTLKVDQQSKKFFYKKK